MKRAAYVGFVFRALFELLLYDMIHGALGITRFRTSSIRQPNRNGPPRVELENTIHDAVVLACCLYWKPVLCLQRSVCAMRMLRSLDIPARVVIGYRPVPFFSHAWVEVDGRVVNDTPVYQRRLTVLHTI